MTIGEEKTGAGVVTEEASSLLAGWAIQTIWRQSPPWLRGAVLSVVLVCLAAFFRANFQGIPRAYSYPRCADITYPDNYDGTEFSIEQHDITVSLLNWHRVPRGIRDKQGYSPVLFKNVMYVRKNRPELKWFVRRHFTSGLPLDFASAHPWRACLAEPAYGRGESQFDQYDVMFDVEGENDDIFVLDYHTTFWNSFQRAEEEFVGVGIHNPTTRVTFSVALPFAPEKTQLAFKRSKIGSNDDHLTEPNPNYQIDGKVVKWEITNPTIDWMYWLYWTWPSDD